MSLFLSAAILICAPATAYPQSVHRTFSHNTDYNLANGISYHQPFVALNDTLGQGVNTDLPDPSSVLYKSMIIPGWGQIVNKQAWKVPIVYGILGGLGYFSVHLTKKYHDYRAAYYNLNPRPPSNEPPTDQRFGPTPSYIPENASLEQIRNLRNEYRNNRDLVYVGIVLAYGLNIIDAYVFAHMRSFDVSEDLSMRPTISPGIMAQSNAPGITLSIDLITK
ncbi:DUF5683 domain-containing protein [Fodinibius sp. Rm-B-1B1-1]|uniref:DUF5683 domain-containing protein n=1 Tax=Fodinibius alkaliphilus TaxID=3140241 RepID=UPI00315AA587